MQNINEENKVNDPQPFNNNRITINTLASLEEQDREFTRNMTYNERMEYLQKLISITHSEEDLKELERKFRESRINIRKPE